MSKNKSQDFSNLKPTYLPTILTVATVVTIVTAVTVVTVVTLVTEVTEVTVVCSEKNHTAFPKKKIMQPLQNKSLKYLFF